MGENVWRLRATVVEGGGMADSASVEIDRMWVEIDYAVPATVIVRVRFEAAGIAEALLGVRGLARRRAETLGIAHATLGSRAVARRRDKAVAATEKGTLARALEPLRTEAIGMTETTVSIVAALGEAIVRAVTEAVAMAETIARPRRLARIYTGIMGMAGAVARVGGIIGAAAAIITTRIRMLVRTASRLSVRPSTRMNVPPARR